jgi:hypothetical protein
MPTSTSRVSTQYETAIGEASRVIAKDYYASLDLEMHERATREDIAELDKRDLSPDDKTALTAAFEAAANYMKQEQFAEMLASKLLAIAAKHPLDPIRITGLSSTGPVDRTNEVAMAVKETKQATKINYNPHVPLLSTVDIYPAGIITYTDRKSKQPLIHAYEGSLVCDQIKNSVTPPATARHGKLQLTVPITIRPFAEVPEAAFQTPGTGMPHNPQPQERVITVPHIGFDRDGGNATVENHYYLDAPSQADSILSNKIPTGEDTYSQPPQPIATLTRPAIVDNDYLVPAGTHMLLDNGGGIRELIKPDAFDHLIATGDVQMEASRQTHLEKVQTDGSTTPHRGGTSTKPQAHHDWRSQVS